MFRINQTVHLYDEKQTVSGVIINQRTLQEDHHFRKQQILVELIDEVDDEDDTPPKKGLNRIQPKVPRAYQCKHCNEVFANFQSKMAHEDKCQDSDEMDDLPRPSHLPPYVEDDDDDSQIHIVTTPPNSKSPERKAECKICGKMIVKRAMNRHVKEKHNKDESSLHTCNLCNKTFARKFALDKHNTSVTHQKKEKEATKAAKKEGGKTRKRRASKVFRY